MRLLLRRLGPIPYVIIGLGILLIGLVSLNHLTSNLWLFDPQLRYDLLQALGDDRATSSMLLEAALPEMIIAFLSVIVTCISGIALPVSYYLNRRFGTAEPHPLVVLRQAMWAGFWVAGCAWLQMLRALTIAVAILVLGVLILFELLLQIRGKAAFETKALLEV